MNSSLIKKKRITIPLKRLPYPGKICSLTSSSCPAFFPASAVTDGGMIHLYYSVEGYRPLKQCRNLSAEQVLCIAKSVLRNISSCRDWLWFPEDYVLSADTVWVNGQGTVRFLCIPDPDGPKGLKRFCGLLSSMEQCTDETGIRYLQQLKKTAVSENLTPAGLQYEVDQLIAAVRSYSAYHSI